MHTYISICICVTTRYCVVLLRSVNMQPRSWQVSLFPMQRGQKTCKHRPRALLCTFSRLPVVSIPPLSPPAASSTTFSTCLLFSWRIRAWCACTCASNAWMCVRVGVAVKSARSCVSVSLCVCVSDFFLRVFVCGCVGASAPVMACSWCVRDWSTPQTVSLGVGTHVSMIVSKKQKIMAGKPGHRALLQDKAYACSRRLDVSGGTKRREGVVRGRDKDGGGI